MAQRFKNAKTGIDIALWTRIALVLIAACVVRGAYGERIRIFDNSKKAIVCFTDSHRYGQFLGQRVEQYFKEELQTEPSPVVVIEMAHT
ncbi:MAG: hypothetical protein GF344_04295, partial [Chitinivibrionales bacterium]|nr:hypothetical protein [Chitinivibrionales bacterium]